MQFLRRYWGQFLLEGFPCVSPPSGGIPNLWELIADGTGFDLEKIAHGALSTLMKKMYLFEGWWDVHGT